MTSIVVHYKELALKGKNRPWFIQRLVSNLKTALAGLHVASVRASMGRIELSLRPEAPVDEVRERLSRIFGIANFSYASRGPHDFKALASAILAGPYFSNILHDSGKHDRTPSHRGRNRKRRSSSSRCTPATVNPSASCRSLSFGRLTSGNP